MLHNKLTLLTVLEYLTTQLEQPDTYQREFIQRIKVALDGYLIFHRLSPEEAKTLTDLGNDTYMKKIREIEINYGLFAMELLVLHKDKLSINISKKKILQYKSNLIKDLLKLKYRNEESYAKVKAITDDSRITAKSYYHYTEGELHGL